MIRCLGLGLVLAVYSCSLLQAGEAEIKAKLDALKAVAKEEASGKESPDGRPNLVVYASGLEALFAQKDYIQMQESLRSGMSYFIKSEKSVAVAQELGVLLVAAVQEQKDRAQKEIDALLSEQGKVLLTAKTPKEVDPILAALQRAQTQMGAMSGRRYYDGNSLESAVRVAANWQDFLRNRQNGNISDAQNQLRQIQENLTRIPQFVPRSVVGEMMDQMSSKNPQVEPTKNTGDEAARKARELIAAAKSTSDIPRLYEEINALPLGSNDRNNYKGLYAQILKLKNAQESIKTNDIDTAMNLLRRQENEIQESDFLRRALVLEALPVYMEQPGFKLSKEDSVNSLIDRMVREAAKKSEWSAVYRGLHAYRVFGPSNSSGNMQPALNDDIQAVGNLISGYNYERAEQWTSAVRYYLTALRTAKEVDVVPFVSQRLKDIEARQPEAYKAGLTPAESTYPRPYYTYPPGMSSPNARPGQPAAGTGTEKPDYLPPGPLDKTKEVEPSQKKEETAPKTPAEKKPAKP